MKTSGEILVAFPNPDTQFKSGSEWTGNKNGRPKGKNRSTVLREIYDMVVKTEDPLDKDKEKEMSIEEAIMRSLVAKALEGDVPAIRESQDTVYGKIKDNVDLNIAHTHDDFIKAAKEKMKQGGLSE